MHSAYLVATLVIVHSLLASGLPLSSSRRAVQPAVTLWPALSLNRVSVFPFFEFALMTSLLTGSVGGTWHLVVTGPPSGHGGPATLAHLWIRESQSSGGHG